MRNVNDTVGEARKQMAVLGLLVVGALLLTGCDSGAGTSGATFDGRRLATRSKTVDSIGVSVTPTSISDKGATFSVALDTHSGDLSIDLARSASLTVAGRDWPVATTSGDGPGGHHREETVRFDAGGPATAVIRLEIVGLARPVSFTWQLSGAASTSSATRGDG